MKEKKYTKKEYADGIVKAYDTALKNFVGDEQHTAPSPETRERLTSLEANQNNIMQELQELKQMIKDLSAKVDTALEKKADKEVVDKMSNDLESLKNWKWKMAGIGVVVVFILYVIKDYLMKIIT